MNMPPKLLPSCCRGSFDAVVEISKLPPIPGSSPEHLRYYRSITRKGGLRISCDGDDGCGKRMIVEKVDDKWTWRYVA